MVVEQARAVERVPFNPPTWLRNPHLQSALPSLWWWRLPVLVRARALRAAAQPILLECADGVRLSALVSQQASAKAQTAPWVVLLHGWLGHAESTYVLSLGAQLYAQGFQVVRLNLRDHGVTEHLNPGLFHSCLLPEVIAALQVLRDRYHTGPLSLAGFSLGGNFALRVAASQQVALQRVVAICPALNPHACDAALAAGLPMYRQYFLANWKQSLKRKQQLFPDRYQFEAMLKLDSINTLTDELVKRHAGFSGVQPYYDGYSLLGDRLATLSVPCHVLLSEDDPIVPVADRAHLAASDYLHLYLSQFGGHCGFVEGWRTPRWVDRWAMRCLNC